MTCWLLLNLRIACSLLMMRTVRAVHPCVPEGLVLLRLGILVALVWESKCCYSSWWGEQPLLSILVWAKNRCCSSYFGGDIAVVYPDSNSTCFVDVTRIPGEDLRMEKQLPLAILACIIQLVRFLWWRGGVNNEPSRL